MHDNSKPLRVILSEARLEAKMSQKQLAEASGITPALISKYESGKSKPRAETLERLALVLGIDKSLLLESSDDCSNIILIDYIVDDSRNPLTPTPYGVSSSLLRELKCRPSGMAAFLVLGDSMSPIINSGDTVLVDKSASNVIDSETYLINYNGEFLVKRMYRLFSGEFRVVSDNPRYPDNFITNNNIAQNNLTIIGKVIWRGGAI